MFITANFLRYIEGDYEIEYDFDRNRFIYKIKEGHKIYMSGFQQGGQAMTTEQREAIKNIKAFIKSIRSDLAEESEDNQELANDLDTVLSLIEEYQTEIKSRDERITELEKDVISLNYRIEKLKNQIEEKDKEIKELKGRGLQEQGRN